jgi:anti-sigma B factor antagonist
MSEQPHDELAGDAFTPRHRFDVHVDRHLVAHVSGELDVSTAPRFAVELDRLTVDGGVICVDVASLEFCGAAGINVLSGARRRLGSRGRLVIYDPSPRVARIMSITGLDRLVDVVVGRVLTSPRPPDAPGTERGPAHRTGSTGAVARIPSGPPSTERPAEARARTEAERRR